MNVTSNNKAPILYSFRRCPYAMRARTAIIVTHRKCILREVDLKNKPEELMAASNKALVPVMILENNSILEESLDIMLWAFDLKSISRAESDLITRNDQEFKYHLDRYKYANRYEKTDSLFHREKALPVLDDLETLLIKNKFLLSNDISFVDFAILPFIRQFANTNIEWFENSKYKKISEWLKNYINSELFTLVMRKYKPWQKNDFDLLFP